jgi:hypothetical protein
MMITQLGGTTPFSRLLQEAAPVDDDINPL